MRLIDPAMREARDALSIRDPVDVRFVPRIPAANGDPGATVDGRYNGWRDGRHSITLVSTLPFYVVSPLLWHELVHAAQAEREGSWANMKAAYGEQLREAGIDRDDPNFYADYRTIPFEREAYDIQAEARRGRRPLLVYDPDDPRCQVDAILSDIGGRR